MTKMQMAGTLLKASTDGRVKTYLLAPIGEPGRTNLGKVTLTASSLTVPEDVTNLVVNVEHEPTAPVAKFARIEATDTGWEADVRFLATTAGDDALTEVNEGVRTGISVEIDGPVIRDGRLLAGTLDGAAVCVDPAFPSARMVAADAGEMKDEQTPEGTAPEDETDDESEKEAHVADEQTVETVEDENTEALQASLPSTLRKNTNKAKEGALFASLAAATPAERDAFKVRLNASLDQATTTDLAPSMAKQWLGEVGAKATYTPRVVDLVAHDNLVGLQGLGWRFTDGDTPEVGTYAGFPNEPHSNEVTTEAVTLTATRLAGAGEVDRAWIDFPVPEFWAAFYRESTNDYKRKLDAIALAAMVDGATEVEPDETPEGVSTAASYIVDGALSVVTAEHYLPSFALVGIDLYRGLLLTRQDDLVAFLTGALGLEEGSLAGFKIRPSSAASMTGAVLVGARPAFTVFELPGASPVRVDTVNIATGGVTTGVFGYHAELVNDAASLAYVAVTGS